MVHVLESSAERRLRGFRRGLVLDLYTRHGAFWERVAAARARWRVDAEARLPPTLLVRRVHAPVGLAREFQRPWPPEAEERYIRWLLELELFHDAFVPPAYQVPGQQFMSCEFWAGFLSACIVFDPPPDDLLGFADHPTAAYADYLESFEGDAEDASRQLTMLAPPIRYWEDPEVVIERERDRLYRILDALGQRLADRGIELREVVDHIEFWDRADEERGLAAPTPRPCIVVESYTTESDVRGAFRILTSGRRERPRPLRPRRDPLTAVQCAVLYDDLGWDHERIAARFGWTMQYPAEAKPRCEAARQHIAEGREIRDQRSAAA